MKKSGGNYGFILWEMMVAIALLASFSILASSLLATIFRTYRNTADAGDMFLRADQAIGALRADAWAARKFELLAPSKVRIDIPDYGAVTWQADASGTWTRQPADKSSEQRWPHLEAVAFSVHGPALRIESPTSQSMELPSQLQLADEVPP